jgi:hypothetical protein
MEYIHILYECHIIQRVTYIFIFTDFMFFPAFSCTLILQDGNASSKKINSNWETVFLEYSSNSGVQYMEFDAYNLQGEKSTKNQMETMLNMSI